MRNAIYFRLGNPNLFETEENKVSVKIDIVIKVAKNKSFKTVSVCLHSFPRCHIRAFKANCSLIKRGYEECKDYLR